MISIRILGIFQTESFNQEFSVATKNNQHLLKLTLLELDWHCVSVDVEIFFGNGTKGKIFKYYKEGQSVSKFLKVMFNSNPQYWQ